MNLPNKLTVLRMLMIPVFLLFYFAWMIPYHFIWALLVFAAASITDMIDGKIARKYGLITDFGKLMDPLADKLLVTAALCCLLQGNMYLTISLILILSREFLVTSLRLIAAGKGEVLAADMWGKIKTVAQMVWVCFTLLGMSLSLSGPAEYAYDVVLIALFAVVVAVTVLSGVHYVVKNRKLFMPEPE